MRYTYRKETTVSSSFYWQKLNWRWYTYRK